MTHHQVSQLARSAAREVELIARELGADQAHALAHADTVRVAVQDAAAVLPGDRRATAPHRLPAGGGVWADLAAEALAEARAIAEDGGGPTTEREVARRQLRSQAACTQAIVCAILSQQNATDASPRESGLVRGLFGRTAAVSES